MVPVWYFQSEEWDADDRCIEHTIEGKDFQKLMDLCFDMADVFSFGLAGWTYAKDKRLENTLQKFQVDTIQTNRWFCYMGTSPGLSINLYRAAEEAKNAILQYINHLFLWDNEKNFCSLEDLCFFRENELFLGTVTHERICYAHILSEEFGNCLKGLGTWKDCSDHRLDHCLAYLNLKSYTDPIHNNEWKKIMSAQLERAARFEIHCWNEERKEIEMALRFGTLKDTNWSYGKVIAGTITKEFTEFLLSCPKPSDTEIYDKITPFFSIFLDNGFSSEHYGTELNQIS